MQGCGCSGRGAVPAAEGWDGAVSESGSRVHCAPHQGTAGFPAGTMGVPRGQVSSESEVLNMVLLWEL